MAEHRRISEVADFEPPPDLPPPPPAVGAAANLSAATAARSRSGSLADVPLPPPLDAKIVVRQTLKDLGLGPAFGGQAKSEDCKSSQDGAAPPAAIAITEVMQQGAVINGTRPADVTKDKHTHCSLCSNAFDETDNSRRKMTRCTWCPRVVCTSCACTVKLESLGETEARCLCLPCVEDAKKKVHALRGGPSHSPAGAGRGTGFDAPPPDMPALQRRGSASASWSPLAGGRGMRRESIGGRGDGGSLRGSPSNSPRVPGGASPELRDK